jgi:hypothetical protein
MDIDANGQLYIIRGIVSAVVRKLSGRIGVGEKSFASSQPLKNIGRPSLDFGRSW